MKKVIHKLSPQTMNLLLYNSFLVHRCSENILSHTKFQEKRIQLVDESHQISTN